MHVDKCLSISCDPTFGPPFIITIVTGNIVISFLFVITLFTFACNELKA